MVDASAAAQLLSALQMINVSDVHAVSLKLPKFWPSRAKGWFEQAESQFVLRGITKDETKYHHVMSSLDMDTVDRLTGFLDNPPTENKYDALKAKMVTKFAPLEYERGVQLLDITAQGLETPGKLMDRMLRLWSDMNPEAMFRTAFLCQMPSDVRMTLIQSNITDPEKLAALADSLCKAHDPVSGAIRSKSRRRMWTARMDCVGTIVSSTTRPTDASSHASSPHHQEVLHQRKTPMPAASRGDSRRRGKLLPTTNQQPLLH